ncbi:MAG: hypothetical protein PHD15_04690 [Clostridia bacterium]|nr:hypothetical protein [Clostridia bacterium]MDD4387037.1 hypothetical protein [Clostridia bacterium]
MIKTLVIFFDLGGVLCRGESLEGRDYLIFCSIYGIPLKTEDIISMSKNPPTESEIKDVIIRCHRLYESDLFANLIGNVKDCNLIFGIATNSPKEVVLFTESLEFIQKELIVISSLEGISKPQLEFFEKMIDISKKYNPDKIIFLDDKQNIVDAANIFQNITAFKFDNAECDSLFEFIKSVLK